MAKPKVRSWKHSSQDGGPSSLESERECQTILADGEPVAFGFGNDKDEFAHIIKCVNLHEELVEACKAVVEQCLISGKSAGKSYSRHCRICHSDVSDGTHQPDCSLVRIFDILVPLPEAKPE